MGKFKVEFEIKGTSLRGCDLALIMNSILRSSQGAINGAPVYDVNGNSIGRWKWEPDEKED